MVTIKHKKYRKSIAVVKVVVGGNAYAFLSSFLKALFTLRGLCLPKEPAKRFPFLVFLSPLPIIQIFRTAKIEKPPQ
jgi:hypothetical protein